MRLPGRTVPVLSLAHVSPVLRAQFLSPFSLFLLIFSYLPYSTPALLFRTHFTTLAPVVQVDKKQNEIFAFRKNSVIMAVIRGVAQPGRVLGLGPRCRRFEPSHPDQLVFCYVLCNRLIFPYCCFMWCCLIGIIF